MSEYRPLYQPGVFSGLCTSVSSCPLYLAEVAAQIPATIQDGEFEFFVDHFVIGKIDTF